MRHQRGILGTIIFHGILLLLFLFFGYSTPLPLPPEEGILINFGSTESGSGKIEPIMAPVENTPAQPAVSSPKAKSNEEILTQDIEEAPVIEEKKKQPVENKKATEPDRKNEPVKEPEEKKPVEKPREVNQKALFPAKNNSGDQKGEGENTEKGNQGSPFGSPDAKSHDTGSTGSGNTPEFSLAGRNALSLPKPAYNYQVEGKVVVEVQVDRYGNVINAVPGVRGSTTLNEYLLDAAKKAALKAKFDVKTDAQTVQKGTITYHFLLQ